MRLLRGARLVLDQTPTGSPALGVWYRCIRIIVVRCPLSLAYNQQRTTPRTHVLAEMPFLPNLVAPPGGRLPAWVVRCPARTLCNRVPSERILGQNGGRVGAEG